MPPHDGRPARGDARLLRARPTSPRTRCSRGCSRPPTPTTRRPPATSAASPRARCATARPTPRSTVIDALEEAGLPPELTEDGLVIDVELDEATAETWMRSFTDIRLALATRLGVEEGDEDYWATAADEDDPRGQAHDIYQWVGYLQETLVDALILVGWRDADPGLRRRDAPDDRPPRDVAAGRDGGGHAVLATTCSSCDAPTTTLDAGHRHPRARRGTGRGRRPRGARGDRRGRQRRPARLDRARTPASCTPTATGRRTSTSPSPAPTSPARRTWPTTSRATCGGSRSTRCRRWRPRCAADRRRAVGRAGGEVRPLAAGCRRRTARPRRRCRRRAVTSTVSNATSTVEQVVLQRPARSRARLRRG